MGLPTKLHGRTGSAFIARFLILLLALYAVSCKNPLPPSATRDRVRLQEILRSLDSNYWEDPSRSLALAREAVTLSEQAGDSNTLARAMLRQASCLQLLDSTDSSLLVYENALKIAGLLRNDSLIAKCRNGIANYYLRKEKYPEATRFLTEALASAEKAGDRHCTGLVYNGLGLVSVSLKEYDKAIDYFEQARRICQELGDLSNEAGISLNIANCYAELNNFAKARDFYEENLTTQLRLRDTSQIVLAYINLGIVNRSLGRPRESFEALDKALAYFRTYDNQSLLCTVTLEIGSNYLDQGNLALARNYLLQSLDISTGTLAKTNAMEALSRLSQVEERQGNFARALDYYKRYTTLKDSVMNDETRKSIAEIRLQAAVQKKEYENELLQKKYEIQKRKSLEIAIILGSLVIGILMAGTLIWLSLKNLRKSYRLQELTNAHLQEKITAEETINRLEKLRLESELEAKNKELTTTSLQLISKNKILSDLSRIAEDYYRSEAMNRESFTGLQRVLKENLNSDRDWEQFKGLFENVHKDFFTGLKSNYPELTEHELRLCAYLRINLQNKEIAKILNVSPATVTTSRYRIRKKIHLDTKVGLEDFLRNFN